MARLTLVICAMMICNLLMVIGKDQDGPSGQTGESSNGAGPPAALPLPPAYLPGVPLPPAPAYDIGQFSSDTTTTTIAETTTTTSTTTSTPSTTTVPTSTTALPTVPPSTITTAIPTETPTTLKPIETVEKELSGGNLLGNKFLAQNSGVRVIPLRVMTFNVWLSGRSVESGLEKIAKHIRVTDPDIAVLQECDTAAADSLVQLLDSSKWRHCKNSKGEADYILTKLEIAADYDPSDWLLNTGCRIRLTDEAPQKYINVWGVHLDPRDYGPYTVCIESKEPNDQDLKLNELLQANEFKAPNNDLRFGRMNNAVNLMNHKIFLQNLQETDQTPLILAGDFNAPSHLDWTLKTRNQHCNKSFEWPVSKLMHDSGFKDSYRQVHPDEALDTGPTWSPVTKMYQYEPRNQLLEPQDRIDYIYYRSDFMRTISSRVYTGSSDIKQVPDHRSNDWPSDHATVISEFEILVR